MRTKLALGFGLTFEDLYRRDGLIRLDQAFADHLRQGDPALFNRLMAARAAPDALPGKDESELLIDAAPHLEDFIGALFGIEPELAALQAGHEALAPLYRVKRLFVQRRAVKGISAEQADALDGAALAGALEALIGEPLSEAAFAAHVERWTADEAAHAAEIDLALRYRIVAAEIMFIRIQTTRLDRAAGLAHSPSWQGGQRSAKLDLARDC